MVNYPPYVNAYGSIKNLFDKIREAAVPPKFTQDFLATVLDLKSSSYRAMIPFLKRLGFIDQNNVPTESYKEYRGDVNHSKKIMADRLKESYADLYKASEYAHKLTKEQIISKLKTVTGVGDDDKIIPAVAGSFIELCKLADFDSKATLKKETPPQKEEKVPEKDQKSFEMPNKLGLSYTINLNLPATTDVEVFNSIFKSLKEHILKD